MRSRTEAVLAGLVAVVVLAACAAGCGDGGAGPRPKATSTPDGASSRPTPDTAGPFAGTSWRYGFGSKIYDARLGGIYQAVGVVVFESGAVRLVWRAGHDAAGAPPAARVAVGPGVVEVWISDLRPHVDLMHAFAIEGGPVNGVSFAVPDSDSLVILRLNMRDPSATPEATLNITGADSRTGRIDVVPAHE